MNKEDIVKQKFKTALISTVKAISGDLEIDNKKNNSKISELKISQLENIYDKNQFTKLRAETDSEALKIKFSDENILSKNLPSNVSCQTLYKISEKIRYELLGSEMLKGIAKNFKQNYQNKIITEKPDNISKKEEANPSS